MTLLKRELLLGRRQSGQIALLVMFVLLAGLLFPIAIGPEPEVLSRIAAGLIWVVILFGIHQASVHIWQTDLADGTLSELIHRDLSLEVLVMAKITSVWILYFSSMILLTPILAIAFGLDSWPTIVLMLSLILASLPLSALTTAGGLMINNHSNTAMLAAIILMPLYLPMLIFSCSAVEAASTGQATTLPLMMLSGINLGLTPVLVFLNVTLLRWQD